MRRQLKMDANILLSAKWAAGLFLSQNVPVGNLTKQKSVQFTPSFFIKKNKKQINKQKINKSRGRGKSLIDRALTLPSPLPFRATHGGESDSKQL